MPEHAGGLGYADSEMVLYKDKKTCPRCGGNNVKKIIFNEREKNRKCGDCNVVWTDNDPENSWSIIAL
jgi:transposase-like protein